VSRYIDEHRGRFGVEPICRVLDVSASAFYQRATGRRSARQVEDERQLERIREVHAANYYAYGYRRMWKTLLRAGEPVPRCRVAAADARVKRPVFRRGSFIWQSGFGCWSC
jgi:putative transposase